MSIRLTLPEVIDYPNMVELHRRAVRMYARLANLTK